MLSISLWFRFLDNILYIKWGGFAAFFTLDDRRDRDADTDGYYQRQWFVFMISLLQ